MLSKSRLDSILLSKEWRPANEHTLLSGSSLASVNSSNINCFNSSKLHFTQLCLYTTFLQSLPRWTFFLQKMVTAYISMPPKTFSASSWPRLWFTCFPGHLLNGPQLQAHSCKSFVLCSQLQSLEVYIIKKCIGRQANIYVHHNAWTLPFILVFPSAWNRLPSFLHIATQFWLFSH